VLICYVNFFASFRSVKVLPVNPFVPLVGCYLKQDDDGEGAIFYVLEEVKISVSRLRGWSDEEYQRRVADANEWVAL
jgi:hypothetical protein